MLQIVLQKVSSSEAIDCIIDSAMKQRCFMLDIYALGISEDDVRAEIENYRSQMTSFMEKHVALEPHSRIHSDRSTKEGRIFVAHNRQ